MKTIRVVLDDSDYARVAAAKGTSTWTEFLLRAAGDVSATTPQGPSGPKCPGCNRKIQYTGKDGGRRCRACGITSFPVFGSSGDSVFEAMKCDRCEKYDLSFSIIEGSPIYRCNSCGHVLRESMKRAQEKRFSEIDDEAKREMVDG